MLASRICRGVSKRFAPVSSRTAVVRGFSTGEQQDVVVIGGGPGGYEAAIKAAQLGLKVTCVEKRGSLGGTCLNVGCIPSKALLHSSHMYHDAQHTFEKHGIKVEGVSVDVPAMIEAKNKSVAGLCGGIEYLFKKNKVTYAKGMGTIANANEVTVEGNDGNVSTINTKNIIVATGSEVTPLPGVEIDEQDIVSSTGALDINAVPESLVVIGGGVIGLEMGSVWSRLGTDVTVVEYLPRLVPSVDDELEKSFRKILGKQGFNFKLNTKVNSAKKGGNGIELEIESSKGGSKETIKAEKVLVAIGRRPYTDKLGLENVGVEMDGAMIKVDDNMRTNVPNIYAIGDVIRGPMLAHKASEEGFAVAEMLAGKYGHVNYDCIPSVVYTHPELAWVGKTEQELKAAGVQYTVGKFPFSANSRAKTNQDTDGMVKVLSEKKTDRIMGIHILGTNAGELIAEGCLALEYGASSEDIARTCHAHPTLSEAVKEAAMAAYDKPIHF